MNTETTVMKNEKFLNKLKDQFPEIEEEGVLLADGLEEAFIGIGWQFNTKIAIYDMDKAIEILFEDSEMTMEEAIEYFDYNVLGAYVGENTPVFMQRFEHETKH